MVSLLRAPLLRVSIEFFRIIAERVSEDTDARPVAPNLFSVAAVADAV